MAEETVKKTILMALGICLTCSFFIATAAVSLSSIQAGNKQKDKIKNILIAGGLYEKGVDVERVYTEKIEPVLIDLMTGELVGADRFGEDLDIQNFDINQTAKHGKYGKIVSSDLDLAKINRMPKFMVVYYVREKETIRKIILPVYGRGLYSMLYGFLAIGNDLKKVAGITFYEQGETAGLGGEITNPRWQERWRDKHIYGEDGKVKLSVVKGSVDPASSDAKFQIDGISGATMTSRGVDNLVKFWLGPNGYGPYLSRLAAR